jgi:hypothetical protein
VITLESTEQSQGEKVKRLEEEVNYLRGQLQTHNHGRHPPGPSNS